RRVFLRAGPRPPRGSGRRVRRHRADRDHRPRLHRARRARRVRGGGDGDRRRRFVAAPGRRAGAPGGGDRVGQGQRVRDALRVDALWQRRDPGTRPVNRLPDRLRARRRRNGRRPDQDRRRASERRLTRAARRRPCFPPGYRATITVAELWLTTWLETLPWKNRDSQPSPREPTTIVSKWPPSATRSMAVAGSPAGSRISAVTPCDAARRRASSSWRSWTVLSSHGSIGVRPAWTGITLTIPSDPSNCLASSIAVSRARRAGSPPS